MENTVDSGLNKENIPLYMRVYEYYKDLITEASCLPVRDYRQYGGVKRSCR